MKLKLRRVDKWGVVVIFGLFAALWSWGFLPVQHCEKHGDSLRRIITGHDKKEGAMPSGYLLPHAIGNNSEVDHSVFPFKFVRRCPACQAEYKVVSRPRIMNN